MKTLKIFFLSLFFIIFATACSSDESEISRTDESTDSLVEDTTPPAENPMSDPQNITYPQVWLGTGLYAGDVGQTILEYPVRLTISKNSETSFTWVYEETYDGQVHISNCDVKIQYLDNDFKVMENICGPHQQISVCTGNLCSGEFTNPGVGAGNEWFQFTELFEEDRIVTHYNLYEGETAWGIPNVYALVYDLKLQQE